MSVKPRQLVKNVWLVLSATLLAAWLMMGPALSMDFDRLQKSLVSRFGSSGVRILQEWKQLLSDNKSTSELDKLKLINDFFNRKITFSDNMTVWGKQDYWATPLEFIGKGAGDCKGFVIAKYFSLKELGVPIQKLRLTYVKARIGGANSSITQAHMVLAYYTAPDAEPLVLDNLISDIRPASRRPDLIPVFSFNSDGIWAAGSSNAATGSVDRLSKWKDLVSKMQSEGFE